MNNKKLKVCLFCGAFVTFIGDEKKDDCCDAWNRRVDE